MAISKVIYKENASASGTTWVDLTDATASASNIAQSYSAYIADGTKATGSLVPSSYTLVDSMDITVSTTSTSSTYQTAFFVDPQYWTSGSIIYVKIRDKAGPRNGYFVGSDNWIINYQAANSSTNSTQQAAKLIHRRESDGTFGMYAGGSTTGYGLYVPYIEHYDDYTQVDIYKRYNSTSSLTINGTYSAELYILSYAPNQGNPYNYSYT